MPNGSSVPTEGRPPLTPHALRRWAAVEGLSATRQLRVLHGAYRLGVPGFDAIEGLGRVWRERLAAAFAWPVLAPPRIVAAPDGTRKLLFSLGDANVIEAVLIPMETRAADVWRYTLCVSSQVGCAMECGFCATAALGLRRNLAMPEIVGQLQAARGLLQSQEALSNVVFMGMGEPLHNYRAVVDAIEVMRADWGFGLSNRRITVSTVGLLPQLERLVDDTDVAIAVSLTATEDDLRDRLMPINRRFPLAALIETCRRLPIAQRRRITFEYVLLSGVNDSDADALRLVRLLRGIRAKVNLIPFNPHPGSPYRRPSAPAVRLFQERLRSERLSATVRQTRGDRVHAACGQLAAVASGSGMRP